MSVLERIYFFHHRIQAGRFPNANDLAREFEVSPATAHRDIAYLRDRLLAPLAYDQQRNGYFYEQEGFHLPFEDLPKIVFFLGIVQKMAVESGLEHLPELLQLQEKLSRLLRTSHRNPGDLVHCEWVEVEPVDQNIFSTVLTGLSEELRLRLGYRKPGGTPEKRQVDPLKLINYQGRWYLLAWCHLRDSRRLFHLARITAAETTGQRADHTLTDTDYLTGVFGIFKGKEQFRAVIHFQDTAAEIVRRQQWHPEQRMEELDNGVQLTLPVADDRELIMKILQFGSQARVVSPRKLKEKIINEIKKMIEKYDPSSASS